MRSTASGTNSAGAEHACEARGARSAILHEDNYTLREQARDAAARRAVRCVLDGRHDRALRRLGDAVRNRGPRRRARARADRARSTGLEARRLTPILQATLRESRC